MFTFDPAKSKLGTTELFFQETILYWDALGIDPGIIAVNSQRIKERFEPADHDSHYPVAVVGYGPSLAQSWEKIRDYKTIITCSGSHKFLLDRGIVPTYHVESEPRGHKIAMLGEPNKAVTYLIASICNPNYFDKLEASGVDIKLWHILFSGDSPAYKFVPKGDWILTGGSTVGPRAIKMARLLGFTDIHIFGIDGDGKHAGEHTNEQPDSSFVKFHFGRKQYSISRGMLDQLVNVFFSDLNTIPDARFTFHGEGLIQAIAKSWKYQFKEGYPLAVVKDD